MTAQEMAERIFETGLSFGPGCSFVDIENHCGEEVQGDFQFSLPGRPNTIMWAGVSEKFIEAFFCLRKRIEPQPSSFLIYAMDGKVLRMPIAKRPKRGKDYKKPHWMPLTFRVRKDSMPTADEHKAINHRFMFGHDEIPAVG